MSRFRSIFRRAYRLRPSRGALENHISRLRIGAIAPGQMVLLPYSRGLGYFIVPTGGAARVIDSEDFRAERVGFLLSLWIRLRLNLLFKKKKYLQFDEFSLFSFGVKRERKRFTTFNQHLFNVGVALEGDLVTRHPELLTGWAAAAAAPTRAASDASESNRAAIVAHIFYEDTWPDIAEVLKRLSIPFDLSVTPVAGRDRLIGTIRGDFPHAEVETVENRGRDVRPFLELLEKGRLDRYRYVCKIHGKKSNDGGRMSYLGALWRRRSLFDLLAGPDIARKIIDAFEGDASVGMIGPRAFRLPSAASPPERSWGNTRYNVLRLAERMGVAPERFELDFFGGTMFWARPEALRPLRELRLASAFPEEKGLLDGGLEHTTERLFSTSAVAAGYRLADSDGLTVS
jgi:lipopolysaccharide biosynthesis protein